MNYTFNNNQKCFSSFIKEAYFPIIIKYSEEELNNHFIEFNYKDSDMFEFSVNPDTKAIKCFSLTLCNHFSFEKGNIQVPPFTEGEVMIEGPAKTECECFLLKVYDDGVIIDTSAGCANRYLKCGQLILGISDDDSLSSLYITGLSNDEICHVKRELQY